MSTKIHEVAEDASFEEIEKAVTPHRPVTSRYRPNNAMAQLQDPPVEPGSNIKYMNMGLEVFNLPEIDLSSDEAVLERVNQYFEICAKYDSKPSMAGLGMAFGVDWRYIRDMINGGRVHTKLKKLTPEGRQILAKVYIFMETLWENYMTHGKINPVSGIFLGKNQFQYLDRVEHVVTAINQDEELSAEDIRNRYMLTDDDGNIEVK